jgi:hypothetical protein
MAKNRDWSSHAWHRIALEFSRDSVGWNILGIDFQNSHISQPIDENPSRADVFLALERYRKGGWRTTSDVRIGQNPSSGAIN